MAAAAGAARPAGAGQSCDSLPAHSRLDFPELGVAADRSLRVARASWSTNGPWRAPALSRLPRVLAVVIASPVIACVRLTKGPDQFRPHFRQVAELAERLAGQRVQLYWGSLDVTGGLAFYLPEAQLLTTSPWSAEGRAAISAHGLVVVCLTSDDCVPASRAKYSTRAARARRRSRSRAAFWDFPARR